MTIQDLLLKRFATKKFDPTKSVSDENLQYILECGRLSCSSANTQPWKILVITNRELREKLSIASYKQPQVTDASHLLVICTMKHAADHAEITKALIANKAGTDSAERYMKMVQGSTPTEPERELAWLQRQVYLPLQAMILAAIEKGIDSCPMEGFTSAEYTKILELTDCVPTALLTLGYAAEPGFEKVRLSLDQIVVYRT